MMFRLLQQHQRLQHRIHNQIRVVHTTASLSIANERQNGTYFIHIYDNDDEWLKWSLRIIFTSIYYTFRCCACNCQGTKAPSSNPRINNAGVTADTQSHATNMGNTNDVGCQTLSTGDIVIMKVYFKEDPDKGTDRVVLSSPKRIAQ